MGRPLRGSGCEARAKPTQPSAGNPYSLGAFQRPAGHVAKMTSRWEPSPGFRAIQESLRTWSERMGAVLSNGGWDSVPEGSQCQSIPPCPFLKSMKLDILSICRIPHRAEDVVGTDLRNPQLTWDNHGRQPTPSLVENLPPRISSGWQPLELFNPIVTNLVKKYPRKGRLHCG